MEKLSRIIKLQLLVILKGFFPTLNYIKLKANSKVVLKKHFFSFKKIKLSLDDLIDEMLPSYMSSLELNTEKLKDFNLEYKLLVTRKEKIAFLYNKYISLSHSTSHNFAEYIFNSTHAPIRVTKYSKLADLKTYLISKFKSNKIVNIELQRLKLLPSTEITSYQEKILEAKQRYMLQHRYGKIFVDTLYSPVSSISVQKSGKTVTVHSKGVLVT